MIRRLFISATLLMLLAACATKPGMRPLTVVEREDIDQVIALFAPQKVEEHVRREMTTEYLKRLLTDNKLPEDQMRLAVQAFEDVIRDMFLDMLQQGLIEAFTTEMDAQALQDTRIWLAEGAGRDFATIMQTAIEDSYSRFELALTNSDAFQQHSRDTMLLAFQDLSEHKRAEIGLFFQSRSGKQFVNGMRRLEPVLTRQASRFSDDDLKKEFLRRYEQLLSEEGLLEHQG